MKIRERDRGGWHEEDRYSGVSANMIVCKVIIEVGENKEGLNTYIVC